jgi:hypothetical protein
VSAEHRRLRALLHEAVDLAVDLLERADRRPRVTPADDVIEVDDVARQRARQELKRRGWSPAGAVAKGKG